MSSASLFIRWNLVLGLALAPCLMAAEIPEDLLEDEHVREEFGVNPFTTPSIRKVFEDLRKLRPLPYDELKRAVPEAVPQERTRLALTVGILLSDGFFAVEAEQFYDMEPVGRALLRNARALGSGTRISSHMKSMLEKGSVNNWEGLKEEMARTQKDVEREMVLIRDVDAANLISLAGWLRAFEIACTAALNPYDPSKAAILGRSDIVEYFVGNLETLEPQVRKNELVVKIEETLKDIEKTLDIPEQEILGEAEIIALRLAVEPLLDDLYGGKRLIQSGLSSATPTETKTPEVKTPAPTGGVISGEVPQ